MITYRRWTPSTPPVDPARAAGRAPSRPAVRPVVLLILDGFGCREDAPDNAITRANAPHWRRLLATCPHASIDASELRGRAARRPDGQFGGRPSEHRGGPRRLPGLHAHRRRDPRRRVRAQSGAASTRSRLRQGGDSTLHVLGLLSPGRRAQPRAADRGDGRPGRRRRCRAVASTLSSTAATRRRSSAAASLAFIAGRLRRPSRARAWRRSSVAITRWTATSAGTASRRPTTLLVDGTAQYRAATAAGGARRGLRARRDRRIRQADRDRRTRRGEPARDGRRRRRRVHELPRRPRARR